MGVCCVAASILIRSSEPVAAIGITALVSEMSPASLRATGRLLTNQAETLRAPWGSMDESGQTLVCGRGRPYAAVARRPDARPSFSMSNRPTQRDPQEERDAVPEPHQDNP